MLNFALITELQDVHFEFLRNIIKDSYVIGTPNLTTVTITYIWGIRERCSEDLTADNF